MKQNTAVTNATYSTYVYTNDLLGRRTSKNDEQYSYNIRDELIAADEVSYNYDDIGNRTVAEGKTYTANNLNQYTAIDDFTPQYDADGNQTLIKTSTGIWSVTYNAENRPIRWQSGDTVITMSFDRMGRRVEMRTVKDGEETLQRFVYDNYLCVQQLRTTSNALYHSYVWDPTEPIATRPLIFIPSVGEIAYYFHDGNKNVSDLVDAQRNIVHYSYTPFGTPTASNPSENPFRFSSEFYDNILRLVYYNHRHYNTFLGRWTGRDSVVDENVLNEYGFISNIPTSSLDYLGLKVVFKGITYSIEPKDMGDSEFFVGGDTRLLANLGPSEVSNCSDGYYGRTDNIEMYIEVKIYLEKSDLRFQKALNHENGHCSINRRWIDVFALYSHDGTCLCRPCFDALDAYYSSANALIRKMVNYDNMLYDWNAYAKSFSEPARSASFRQLTGLWRELLDTSSLIQFYNQALQECEQSTAIPMPSQILSKQPASPF